MRREAARLLHIAPGIDAEVIERSGEFYLLELAGEHTALEVMERFGSMPLPPYIQRPSSTDDEARYQTVYARMLGAVAAPTAGLHFDQTMLDRLRARGVQSCFVTLHVGAGTFQPVRSRDLDSHRMHSEWYDVPAAALAAIDAAAAAAAVSLRWGPPVCVRSNPPRVTACSLRAVERPTCSSDPDTVFA
jgi:S-adenosylmethionine:tRNA ribosyltransferase-isomerase